MTATILQTKYGPCRVCRSSDHYSRKIIWPRAHRKLPLILVGDDLNPQLITVEQAEQLMKSLKLPSAS